MDEREKLLRQSRSSLMRECAELEDRVTQGIATDKDKARLAGAKEELIEISSKLAKIVERREASTKRRSILTTLGEMFKRKARDMESKEQKTHSLKYTVKVLTLAIVVLALIFGVTVGLVIYQAGPQAVRQAVADYSTQTSALEDIKNALVARVQTLKNPNFDGIEVIVDKDGFTTILPANMDDVHERLALAMSKRVKEWGYDCILVGDGYTSMSGPFVYRDFKGGTETDMEIMINAMREKGINNCFAFMGNPDHRAMPFPIKNYVQGPLKIEQVEVRRAAILWRTGDKKIVFHSDNLKGQLKGDKLKAKLKDIPLEQVQQYEIKQKEKEKENPGQISKSYGYVKDKVKKGWNWALEKVE